MSAALSDDDVVLAVSFVDGTLRDPERTRFELRMAAEPELAEAVESMLGLDEVLRRRALRANRASRRTVAPPAWRRPVWIAALAAALVAAFVVGLRAKRTGPRRANVEVAVLPGFESARDYVERSGSLRGLRPPGLDVLRAGTEEANVGAAEFAAKAREQESEAARAAFEHADEPVSAGYFVLPFRTEEPRSVVVVAVPSKGTAQRLVPGRDDARPVAEQGRFAAGTHVLPEARFALVEAPGAAPAVTYRRGFLVPIGAAEVEVLFGSRAAPLDLATIDAIDAAIARGETRAELERLGFDVGVRRVLEPRD
jgi:hypothetical protein